MNLTKKRNTHIERGKESEMKREGEEEQEYVQNVREWGKVSKKEAK